MDTLAKFKNTKQRICLIWAYLMERWEGEEKGWTYLRLISICNVCYFYGIKPWQNLSWPEEKLQKLGLERY